MPTGAVTVPPSRAAGHLAGLTGSQTGPTGPQAGLTGSQAGPTGSQAGSTGLWAGQAAAVSVSPAMKTSVAAVISAVPSAFTLRVRAMGWKADIYYDYLDMMTGTPFDASTIKWRLSSSATPMEFQIWESHVDGGFERCKAADSTFGGQIEFDIAYRRVDDVLAAWYRDFLIVHGFTGLRSSWADFK